MMRRQIVCLALVSVATTASFAHAQTPLEYGSAVTSTTQPPGWVSDWLVDRNQVEGAGIRLDDFELHPGLGAEIGYDSNVFFADKNPRGSAILRITPHLALSTLSGLRRSANGSPGNAPTLQFRSDLAASFLHYFVDKSLDNIQGDAKLDMLILPERPISFLIREAFTRSIRPFSQTLGSRIPHYGRIANRLRAEVQGRTRGNVLEGYVGYEWAVDYFESTDFRSNSSMTHLVSLGTTWRFFPYTALIYRADVAAQNFTSPDLNPIAKLSDNYRINSLVGINGAITQRFSLLGMVGYSVGFYDHNSDYDGVIGQAEARWTVTPTVLLGMGYDRVYTTSYIGNFYRQDRVYFRSHSMFDRVFVLGTEISLGHLDYGTPVAVNGNLLGDRVDRRDWRLTASIFGEYRLAHWLGLNATLIYHGDYTNFQYTLVADDVRVVDPARYQKLEAWLGIRAFY